MTIKLRAIDDNGEKILIDMPDSLVPANVVLTNVPCLDVVLPGHAVYIEDVTFRATRAIATSMESSNVIGIVESKNGDVLCNIRVVGTTGPIFTSLDVSKEYYLSDTLAGELVTTPPVASGSIVLRVGQPLNAEKFVVIKGTRTKRA
jgi:hypothetical protein